MPKFKLTHIETVARVYEIEAEDEQSARDRFDDYEMTPVKTYTVSEEVESVEQVDELKEALDSLTSEQYEVISAEIDRLKARIAELQDMH